MLRSLLRAFALAMLVLAVPVQGLAAVSAGICMAFSHHGDAAAAHDHGPAAGHQPDHHAADDHHHDDADAGKKLSHGGHCAPCVSCCAAAAIAPHPPLVGSAYAASPLVCGPIAVFHGVAPHLLDRPPLAL